MTLLKFTKRYEVTSIKWHQRDPEPYESNMNYLEIQMRCFDVFIYSFVHISDKQNINSLSELVVCITETPFPKAIFDPVNWCMKCSRAKSSGKLTCINKYCHSKYRERSPANVNFQWNYSNLLISISYDMPTAWKFTSSSPSQMQTDNNVCWCVCVCVCAKAYMEVFIWFCDYFANDGTHTHKISRRLTFVLTSCL